MGVRRWAVRRRTAVLTVAILIAATAGAEAPRALAAPGQEDPSDGGGGEAAATERGVLDIDVDVASADATTVTEALTDISANVGAQLTQLQDAQNAVTNALRTLTDRDAAVTDTEMRIEQLTIQTDEVVIDAFTSPPADATLDALLTRDATDAAVKQTLVDLQADRDASVLEDLQATRDQLEAQKEEQEAAVVAADEARADAEAALAELEGAVDQQTRFILDVRARVERGAGTTDPELADEISQLAGALTAIEEEERQREAEEAVRRAQEEAVRRGDIVCPVQGGGLNFVDTWGAARSGGRSHQGTDMMAASGTPTPAPTNGVVEYKESGLGGHTWYLHGDNGHTYYGAHLSQYAGLDGQHVNAGTIIGYVGSSGNASATAPHLHFEFHPGGGSAVNPYSLLDRACPGH